MAARVQASFERQAMMATLGVRLSAVGRGRVELVMGHDERFTQQHGFVHAGAVSAVLDSACGYAAFSVMPPDAAVLTAAYTINLLAPEHHYREEHVAPVERLAPLLVPAFLAARAANKAA